MDIWPFLMANGFGGENRGKKVNISGNEFSLVG